MSLNESRHRSIRDRWPLEFDLEGVPRENDVREKLLAEHRGLGLAPSETEQDPMPVNSFAVDKLDPQTREELLRELLAQAPTGTVIDLNNPPPTRYIHKDFPRLVYHHDSLKVLEVGDAGQLKAALKHGYKMEPAPHADYSQIRGGKAAAKEHRAPREEELSAEQLAELDREDAAK